MSKFIKVDRENKVLVALVENVKLREYKTSSGENWYNESDDTYDPSLVNGILADFLTGDINEQFEVVSYKYDNYENYKKAVKKYIEDVKYEHILQDGGGEGEGEHVTGVFKLGDVYIKANWNYYSYDGYSDEFYSDTLDLCYVVEPKRVEVTVYE